jgi:short chain dehydrogenase
MTWTPNGGALRGRVAVVAGATRGAGRGIAAGLGEAGATVICTGRSSVTGNEHSDYDRPETIEETAELVTQLGGEGIAIQVDHLDAAQVRALADRIRRDYRAIDILVNDVWGAEILKGPPPTWNRPMWEPRTCRRLPHRTAGIRGVGITALRRTRRGRNRIRQNACAVEPSVGQLGRTGARVPLHRCRWPPTRRLDIAITPGQRCQ